MSQTCRCLRAFTRDTVFSLVYIVAEVSLHAQQQISQISLLSCSLALILIVRFIMTRHLINCKWHLKPWSNIRAAPTTDLN